MREIRRNKGGWKALEAFDLVILLDQNTQDNPPIFDVTWDGGIPLFQNTAEEDSTGVIPIWAFTVPAAPYVLDPEGATGVIQPLGTKRCKPDALNLGVNELVQARVKIRLIDSERASGAVIDDFSLRCYLPGSSAMWGTAQTPGILSARRQVGDGADSVSAPLQGTDQGGPAFAALSGWEVDDQTELWWYGVNTQPTFELVWMGAAPTPAGIAVGLEVSGYRYLLASHARGSRMIQRGGIQIAVPDDAHVEDIIPIPIAARAASSI